jgi:Tfp pilus assembly protein PilN
MKAVNLIPDGAGRAGGGSGAGAFVLLGALGVLLAGVVAYVLTNNAVVERRAEAAQLSGQIAAVRQQVDATRSYRDFAALAQARVQTVRQLGEARFDWHRAFSDFAKVVPDDVWLTSLLGTVKNGVAVEGAASGATSSLRAALPNPAIELSGCTESHESVARLRLIRGVERVALADSSKDNEGGGDDCRHGDSTIPQFDMVVFFDPIPTVAAPATATAPAAATTPAPTGSPSTATEAR